VTGSSGVSTYPDLIGATEAPVIDTASAATLMLAREIHRHGFKVTLAGEGSDEWLAGYPLFKVHRLIEFANPVPGIRLSSYVRSLLFDIVRVAKKGKTKSCRRSACSDITRPSMTSTALMTASKYAFFNDETLASLDYNPKLFPCHYHFFSNLLARDFAPGRVVIMPVFRRPHHPRVRRPTRVRDDDDDRQNGADDEHRDERRGPSILLRRAALLELLTAAAGAGVIAAGTRHGFLREWARKDYPGAQPRFILRPAAPHLGPCRSPERHAGPGG
jgi:Asparagine synthase